jgi:hypothetical protein
MQKRKYQAMALKDMPQAFNVDSEEDIRIAMVKYFQELGFELNDKEGGLAGVRWVEICWSSKIGSQGRVFSRRLSHELRNEAIVRGKKAHE